MSTANKSEKDRVVIFDTTLRDGEQCPGATMTHEEKLEVAELLDAMGVDIIEAGFPIASVGDFEAVSEIARRTKNAVVAGLARAIQADIVRAGEIVQGAALRQEKNEPEIWDLPRLILTPHRRSFGRFRQLIDAINGDA